VAAYDLLIVEDPRNALLPYDGMLVASPEASKNPVFLDTLGHLIGKISDDHMREANKIVDVDGGSISDAVDYLQSVVDKEIHTRADPLRP
jgi:osmoprotectant transport system permease protein